jgi:multidrug efflux pump subunit AcrB
LTGWFKKHYELLSTSIVRRPGWVVLAFTLPLVAIGYLAFNAVGTGFMPVMDEGGFIIDYYSAPGTGLSETDRLLQQVEVAPDRPSCNIGRPQRSQ